jgi:metallo-beta-lactamase family protein
MKVKFLGAAENVTGSRFLIENGTAETLVDCGLYQERSLQERNWDGFPVDPAGIESVVLTHAHLDHSGYLPRLVKEGFRGRVFCTPPTSEILQISLLDSAKLQEEDAHSKRKRHAREGRKPPHPVVPLYTIDEAKAVFPLLETVPYGEMFQASPGCKAAFRDAGHILGAAMVEMKVTENGREKTLVFSGDIGRWDKPILNDPTVFEAADVVFVESTYGDRVHEKKEDAVEKLRTVILETNQAGGNVVIPTFAVERAQEILYYLSAFVRQKEIPPILTFVNSPMAIDVTEVFKKYPDYFDEETQNRMKRGDTPFDFPLLKTTRTAAESKAINQIKGTSIIMAGSGMCNGGRIKYHLVSNIARRESTILFVGYQAVGTLGREILDRHDRVRILGSYYPVRARIEKLDGFSAHADRNELLRWITAFRKSPERIFVIHGEERSANEFAATLRSNVKSDVVIPAYRQEFVL